eukprot:CAMPEP_0172584126 /NCGR_PEP_ID=MMETSP1068-20121228/3716_1 /TAXON_ID=35684 /ORGANISM="Pseudopedinella elastica, Strain CCMP716" /LENGTH=292 /DNA_ID=CAMNT_0013378205 /DNA_START=22 /DNA_END=904 /DNA_ORIENTATION=-
MGKSDKKAEKDSKKEDEDEQEGEFEEESRELEQVELGDFVKVKQVLDESVVKAVLELDYTENQYWDNIKLVLMVVACLFAMVAQFYPMPFPESRPLLGVCCFSYFVASTVLQLIVTYIEKDCIMVTGPVTGPADQSPKDGAEMLNKTRAGGKLGLRIRTNFPRFSYDYSVAIQLNVKEEPGAPPPDVTSMRFKINDYFTEDGFYDEERFVRHVQSVLKDFEAGEYYLERAWANSPNADKAKKTNEASEGWGPHTLQGHGLRPCNWKWPCLPGLDSLASRWVHSRPELMSHAK